MSITNARNFIEKSGCGLIIALLLALVMGASMFAGCQNQGGGGQGQNEAAKSPVVVKVGKTNITLADVEGIQERLEQMRRQQIEANPEAAAQFDGFTAFDRAQLRVQAIGAAVTSAITTEMLAERKTELTDTAIRAEVTKLLQKQINDQRGTLEQQNLLKPGATQAEFEAAFEKQVGQKPADIIAQQMTQIEEMLKTSATRMLIAGEVGRSIWIDAKSAETQISDAELKTIFDSLELKSILFRQAADQDRSAEAEKVLAEIKSGALTFEAAMDKYSDTPVQQGKKKKSENVDVLSWQFLMFDEDYAPLMKLKQGEVSGVIRGVDGPIIYKMTGRKSALPPDFETRKDFYRQNHKTFIGNASFFREMRDRRAALTTWEMPGMKLLHTLSVYIEDPIVPQNYPAIAKAAAAITGEPNAQFAASARLLAMRRMFSRAQGEARKQMMPDYIDSIEKFLSYGNMPAFNLELVDLLVEIKDKRAGQQLIAAAVGNSTFRAGGQKLNQDVFQRLDVLKKANLITPEEVKQVEQAQQRWMTEKKAFDDNQAKLEAERKKAEEDARKAAEQAEKERAEAQKATGGAGGATPSPTPAPGATGGGASSSDIMGGAPAQPPGGR